MKTLRYETRDADGNDIVKDVTVKEFASAEAEFRCHVCGRECSQGVRTTDIISGSFTDYALIGDYVCNDCADLFSLYFYSYIKDADGIRLLNVRSIRDEITREQKPPFMFVITTSQKKHLFYRARINHVPTPFAVQLETETIYTTTSRMRTLFDFVESLMALGQSKKALADGEMRYEVMQKAGAGAFNYLRRELRASREIQIPIYCGQKRDITDEEAICCINSILTA